LFLLLLGLGCAPAAPSPSLAPPGVAPAAGPPAGADSPSAQAARIAGQIQAGQEATLRGGPQATPPQDSPGWGPHEPSRWYSLAEAREVAAASNRNMLVYVYADWCARCRELEPVIQGPEIMGASTDLIHVRHNSDNDDGTWLRQYAYDYDSYVPRVLFLRPDGTRMQLVSDHPNYPLFYSTDMTARLLSNIEAASQAGM
jgi:thiol-disulfide isomerase/thioredoxin